jgi:TonB-linked SusC/RagA family outer membrane protein
MRYCFALLLLLCAATTNPLAAQATGSLRGVITDSLTRQPVAGARVVFTGTTVGTVSRADGSYFITGTPVGSPTVRITAIGYEAQTRVVAISAGQTATLDIVLGKSINRLDAVAVVGYGTQEKREVTGAVSTVTAEKMKDIPTNDPMKALQGRVAGVEIVTNSNEPGANMQVRIRGVRSMASGRNEPLYVVDGIPINGGIEDFNPAIIDNITVLKDAAATAIYGSRGANGVILVTTKKGSPDGKTRTSYSMDTYFGAQQPIQIIPMMGMKNFVKYLQDAALFNGQDTSLAKVLQGQTFVPGTTTSKRLYAYQNGIETDWQRVVLRDGLQRNAQASVAGQTGGTRYSLSGNYFEQQGAIPGQANTRGNAFASFDHTSSRLKVGMTTSLTRALVQMGVGQGAFGYATTMAPFGRPYNYTNPDSAGLLDPRPDDDPLNINPLLESMSMVREQTNTRVFASAFAELNVGKGLRYRLNFGPDYSTSSLGCYNDPWTHGPCRNPGSFSDNQGQPPQAMLRNQTDFAYTLDNLLTYERDIGDHQRVEVTGLYSIQKDRFTKDSLYATQLPYSTQRWYDLGSGTAGNQLSLISEWALQSYMARVNYTLFNRYTLSATSRADGSSRLAPGNKWAYFPSFSAAWNLSDEGFMRRFGSIDQLKLRASYGTTGNTSISPYQTQGTLSPKFYTFGTTRVRGYRPGSIPNPDLSWEKTDATDIGLEFGFYNGRVSGSFDTYVQNTRDLLLTRLLPVTSGFTSTLQNIGSTRNSGVEIGLSTVNVRDWHGIGWTSDINWSTNKNKITALASGAVSDVGNTWFVGQPINLTGDAQRRVFYDWKWQGVWQYADSVAMKAFNATGSTFKAGDPRVADVNGDGKINADDRMIVGTSYPKWVGGITNRLTWKGFDVSALVTAKIGYTFIDGTPRSYTGRQGVIDDMDYWMPTNPTNKNPAPNVGQVERLYSTTRLYTDGSHWRIRNITAGYTLSPTMLRRLGMQSMRLYGTAQDPYIHTNYVGADPEVAGAAPTMRTLLLGTNITW